jgi:hypothetical protein
MAYGFGKPPQAIEGHFTEARKQILEKFVGCRLTPTIAVAQSI